jgi:aspartyl-tRNA(Asn)/glutamyl-tRNA(Gln) amidotransferase subunit A
MNLSSLTVTAAREKIRAGEISASDLAGACFRQIERLNPLINAFITVCEMDQMVQLEADHPRPARSAMDAVDNSTLVSKRLVGIPVAVKDLYKTRGIRTTSGSKFFADYIPGEDAFVVQKLKEAGAVVTGKTNTHEIALGVTNINPHYGACKNPWDLSRISGGSSGGSAAAVAADMTLAALGTDTGGSIRIPASLCGVVGLKPTYGRVSLRGILPLSWSLDHAGPLTKSVEDAALIMQIIAGYDALDPVSVKTLPGDFSSHLKDGMEGRKVAMAVGDFISESDAEVLSAYRNAAVVFTNLGARVEEVDGSWLREAAFANGLMTTSDGAAFHRERLKEHPDWFGADVRQRLEIGAAYTSSEYALARRKQAKTRRICETLFESYDVLILPTTPIAAPLIEGDDALESARLLTRFTAPFNLTGLPALSIPCGFTKSGLPIGLQIVSRAWNEAGVLRAGYSYEQATDWHKVKPNINA